MGRLVMEARGSAATGAGQGIAAAGNRDEMPIVVSITDADGAPVSGLGAADITIKVQWVDQGEPPEVRFNTAMARPSVTWSSIKIQSVVCSVA